MFDVFSYVFSNVFDSVINNSQLIDNIVITIQHEKLLYIITVIL